ncbi:hypothetical protein JW926_12075 [Candidatus Sumerlaeota bacterium]|nr:hypothetical protein [Candidatus Sumerlaeota bacterium]
MNSKILWEKDWNKPACERALLNGWWEFAPIHDEGSANSLPASYPEKILVPSFWNTLDAQFAGDWGAYRNFDWGDKWNKIEEAAYRRIFSLPPKSDSKILRIRFDAVLAEADVFVNSHEVLEIRDGFLPHEADISRFVNLAGDNVIEVLVRKQPQKNGQFLYPSGSWVGWNLRGIWQDVSLRLEPEIRIADVWILPSVRQKKITILAKIENSSDHAKTIRFSHKVEGEDIHIKSSDENIPAKGSITRSLETPWSDPHFWAPEDPHLYWLQTSLWLDGESKEQVDSQRTRFGFKEFWIEGTRFMLNGIPIRFKGDSWHYMGAAQQNPEYARAWFKMVKEIGANCVRLHAMPHPSFYLDAADEIGICVIDESAVYGSGGNLALKDEAFWNSASEHVKRFVRRDRNHPCVCLWSACNEIVWRGGEESYPKLLSLETAIHEEDPTRPVSFDENNSDMGGGAKIYGGHYGNAASWDANWKKDKPLMVNEFSCLYYSGPEEPAQWVGEGSFADFDIRTRGGGEEARETIIGLRALGAASITPWNFVWYGLHPAFPFRAVSLSPFPHTPGIKTQRIGANSISLNYDLPSGEKLEPRFPDSWRPNAAFDVMRSGYAPLAAFFRERDNNFYDNIKLTRNVDVFNDIPASSTLVVEMTLGSLCREEREVNMAPYERKTLEFTLPIPGVSEPAPVPLKVKTFQLKNGVKKEVHSETMDYWIVPERHFKKGENFSDELGLIDSRGETASLLSGMGYERNLYNPGASDMKNVFSENKIVIIGKGELQDTTLFEFTQMAQKEEFFKRGGALIILEYAFSRDVNARCNPIEREYIRAWRRGAPDFWKNLPDDSALRFWSQNPNLPYVNGAVAKRVFHKPRRGAFIPIAEVADGGDGLEFSPLLWLPLDKGGAFLNGFELVSNARRHPAAAEILHQMIGYAKDHQESCPKNSVRVIGDKNSLFDQLIERTGVNIAQDSKSVIVINASSMDTLKNLDPADLIKHLNKGATIFLFNIAPETAQWASNLSGVDIKLEKGQWENVAKSKGEEFHPLLTGISQDDLVWVKRGQVETISTCGIEMRKKIEPLITTVDTKWAGYADTAEQHKYAFMLRRRQSFDKPHVIIGRIPMGKGQSILSQLELDRARHFLPKAQRIWSLLLANAGASFQNESSALLERLSPHVDEQGYIRTWLVLGSFGGVEQEKILSHDFLGGENKIAPREGDEISGKKWKAHTASQSFLDLRESLSGEKMENVAAYMAIYVHSPRARDIILDTPDMVDLAIGSDDGVKAWLNGEETLSVPTVRPWNADQEKIKGVKLKKGSNLLVLKISQYGGDWKASARFLTSSGLPVTDLEYSIH